MSTLNLLIVLVYGTIMFLLGYSSKRDSLNLLPSQNSNSVKKLINMFKDKPKPGVIRSLSAEELEKRRDKDRMDEDKEVTKEFDKIIQSNQKQ